MARHSTRRRLTVVAAVALALSAAGAAIASIPGPNGVINGCYNTSPAAGIVGSLRVIDSSSSCNAGSENALDWSQRGPTGPAGPPGPAGGGVAYIRYPWHALFTENGKGFYYVGHYATTTMVLPSAGTWVVHAQVRWLDGANVDDCYVGIINGITLPKEINPHQVGYLYYDVLYTWNAFAAQTPQLEAHATVTQASYAVLRCLPLGNPSTDGQLNGSDVEADLEAWKVASADDSNGSTLVGGQTPPATPIAIIKGTELARSISGSTETSLLKDAGHVALTRKLRAQIVLLAGNGETPDQISASTRATPKQVAAAITAFNRKGLASLR